MITMKMFFRFEKNIQMNFFYIRFCMNGFLYFCDAVRNRAPQFFILLNFCIYLYSLFISIRMWIVYAIWLKLREIFLLFVV